jgi:CII-binding regulator of phage lambda lysogenization HflD
MGQFLYFGGQMSSDEVITLKRRVKTLEYQLDEFDFKHSDVMAKLTTARKDVIRLLKILGMEIDAETDEDRVFAELNNRYKLYRGGK